MRILLRALALSLAILALMLTRCSAQSTSSARSADQNNQPLPQLPQSTTSASPDSAEDALAETTLLNLVNQNRKQAGVAPLQMDNTLRQAARAHARLMVANDRLDHQFSGEPALLQRIANVSPLPIDRAGENIADASCPESANEVLMRSAPHRKNLLDAHFNLAGIAAIWSHGRLYVVQDFAHAMPSYSARETSRLVGEAVDNARHTAGLPDLTRLSPPRLDEAACSLARQNHPNAHLLATAYTDRKIAAYTQSQPDALPLSALHLLNDPSLRQFAVGSCYARNAAYPTGMYWIAILLN